VQNSGAHCQQLKGYDEVINARKGIHFKKKKHNLGNNLQKRKTPSNAGKEAKPQVLPSSAMKLEKRLKIKH
jgi:hypothetical protein